MKRNLVITLAPALFIFLSGFFVSLDLNWIANHTDAALRAFLLLLYLGMLALTALAIEDIY